MYTPGNTDGIDTELRKGKQETRYGERERQSPSQHADCRSRRSALAMGHTYPLPLGDTLRYKTSGLLAMY